MRPCCKVDNKQVLLHDLHKNRTLLHNAYLSIPYLLLPRLESSPCPPEYAKEGVAHACMLCTVMQAACLLSNATSSAAPQGSLV